MTFSTDNLRSTVHAQSGLAAGNRYIVQLPSLAGTQLPGGGSARDVADRQALSTLCTSARIPGKNFNLLDRQIGMEPVKVANGHTLGDVSLTFYLTNDYSARKYFQEWSECILSPEPPYLMGFHGDYAKSVYIEQQNRLGERVYRCELQKAYPINISEIELNNQAQGAALELTVTFTYSNYLIR